MSCRVLADGGILAFSRRISQADLLCIGSLFNHRPTKPHPWIWGSGMLTPDDPVLEDRKVFGVRGCLTRDVAGLSETTPLGDPGLLYTDRIRLPRARRHRWGVVSHFEDKRHPFIRELTEHDDTIAIDVCQEPRKVVSAINSCSHIFTTSLHGLIVADSLGIPACWGRPDAQSDTRDFKFNDYHTAYRTMACDQRRADLTRTANLRELKDLAASPEVYDVNRVKNDLRHSRKDLAKALVVHHGRTLTVRNVAREVGLTMWRGHV
ncbi:polysaccharide pyruvyl transferase family protein [Cutibacterium avidum]|uniref:polysaccharide pyruvyl transferase family protein n=1 Tax=Cutibacterium avidum TaxID=33010 RepID=UPI0020926FCC|nr:polysaccharide pyruvyl transferase family protein [Cutibacterium avidum]